MSEDLTNCQIIELCEALKTKDEEKFILLFDTMQKDKNMKEIIDNYIQPFDCSTLLQKACESNLTLSALKLIEAKVDPNKTSVAEGKPPLILAAEKGNHEILSNLIKDKKIEVNTKDRRGVTALHEVISQMGKVETSSEEMNSYVKCLEALLSCSEIDVNAQNYLHETALHLASENGVENAIMLLLKHKEIKLHLKDSWDRTVLYKITGVALANVCTEQETDKFIKCLNILLDALGTTKNNNNIDLINAKDKYGFSSLDHTIYFGVEKAEEVLLLNGALIDKEALGLMSPSSLGCFLDSCINVKFEETANMISSTSAFSITFDYSMLLSNEITSKPEVEDKMITIDHQLDSAENKVETCQLITVQHLQTGAENNEATVYPESGTNELEMKERKTTVPEPDSAENMAETSLGSENNEATIYPESGNVREMKDTKITVPEPDPAKNKVETSPVQTGYSENNEDTTIYPELDNLLHISRFKKYQHLLKHPLIKSFVMLKWHNMRGLYWFTVSFYTVYIFICSFFIYTLHSTDTDGWRDYIEVLWYFLLFLDIIVFIWEFLQFCTIPCLYFRSFENIVDLAMLIFTLIVLFHSWDPSSARPFSAITILLACIEGLFLLSRHPKLSIYITMFSKVTFTFLKLLLWFSILLVGFAFSLFLAFETPPNKEEEKGKFINFHESLLKFSAMMTGEFDFGNLPFDTNFWTSRFVFVLFVFLIVIVLINLLGGLAITDIQAIQNEAEILNTKRQVKSMAILEAILLCDPFNIIRGWTPVRTKCVKRFWLKLTCIRSLRKCIFRSVFLFYESSQEKFCTINFRGKLNGQSQGCAGCSSCRSCLEFQLEEDYLQSARQKALMNYKIEQKLKKKGKSSKTEALERKTEIERRTDIVTLLLELRKERLSEDSKIDQLVAEIQDLKVQINKSVDGTVKTVNPK